jgi:hypothetical protein
LVYDPASESLIYSPVSELIADLGWQEAAAVIRDSEALAETNAGKRDA